jgi:hypothetical protein
MEGRMQQQLMFTLDQNPKGRGLRCDSDGLFLGRDTLVCRDRHGNFEARPIAELQKVLGRVYGDETNWDSRVRSVRLVASALNKGDMARAMMTAVLMRLPDPGSTIRIAEVDGMLAKAGFNPGEPRDEHGRWTSGGGNDERHDAGREVRDHLADAGMSDAIDDLVVEAAARTTVNDDSLDSGRQSFEREDRPNKILVAAEGDDDKDPRFGIGGNHPPPEELIPQKLQQSPAGPAVQFLDNLLDISGPGDEANLEANQLLQRDLLQRIHEVDPNYVYERIEPPGGLAGMSWEGRQNAIHGLQADLAAAMYRVRGDIRPLQEVTLDFLQRATNGAYDEAVQRYNAGELDVRLNREEAIGSYMDGIVRLELREFYNRLRLRVGQGSAIRVNNRAYDSSAANPSYRLPDVRVGNFAFDVSLTAKTSSDPQIRGFFNADFKPIGVVIVRPNQLANRSSYIIWRQEGY